MSTFEIKQVVFDGVLRSRLASSAASVMEGMASAQVTKVRARYWRLTQTRADLGDPENSPSVSMWGFLQASAQTQRLNDISVYVEHGKTSDEMRFLYLNDFALILWRQMEMPVRITGRLRRPPRTALLSFGMPFSE